MLVPVLWAAMYGNRRQLWLAVGGVFVLFCAPLVLLDDAEYPLADWRRVVLWLAVVSVVGPSVQSVVDHARSLQPAGARLDAVLRAATEHSIIATDLSGRITLFNAGAENMLGWTGAEVLGRFGIDALHDPDELALRADELDVAPGLRPLVHAAATGTVETRDWTYVTKDRRRRTVSLSVTGKRDGDGSLIGYIFIATDVTDARAAARDLEAQYRIQQLLLEHLPYTTVALLDRRLRWVTVGGDWSQARRGDSAEPLTGRSIEQTLPAQDAERFRTVFTDAWAHPVHRELRTEEGRLLEVDALPVRGAGRERLILSLMRDVTERRNEVELQRQMSAALALSERSFKSAFEDAPIGVILTSLDAGRGEQFLRVNEAFAQLLARGVADFTDRPLDEIVHPDDRGMPLVIAPSGRAHQTQQKRFVAADGRTVWVELTSSLVRDQAGAPSFFISHVEDITSRTETERMLVDALEQQRAATAALRELDKIRSDVVATISHELRTPLTSITGYLEVLAAGECGTLELEQNHMVVVAKRNADRLAELVDNLLVLARLDAHHEAERAAAAVRDEVVLQQVVSESLEATRFVITQRGQAVVTDLPEYPVTVHGDAEQLRRVLVNLVSNAAKFTDPGGRIEIGVAVERQQAHLTVRDTGIGIPEKEQAALFDRFYRGSSSHARAIGGSGLGLSIVKSIVERHHGDVRVSSRVGAGSTFDVAIPLAPAALAGPALAECG